MEKTIKNVEGKDYEVCLFPMEAIAISQKDHVGTHSNSYALDSSGIDTGKDYAYAPCTMTRKYYDTNYGNTVWFESDEEVFRADGTIGYVTMMFVHCDDEDFIDKLNFKQGERFYREGKKGEVKGNHVHMEAAWGKYKEKYIDSSKNNYGLKDCGPIPEIMCVDQSQQSGLGFNGLPFKKSTEVAPFTGWKLHNYEVSEGPTSDYYYFEKGLMKKGWLNDPAGGWYFLNDGTFDDVREGAMVRKRWIADDKGRWCFVNAGGAMIADGQAYIDGKWYQFDKSGYCINPEGAAEQFDDIPVIKIED